LRTAYSSEESTKKNLYSSNISNYRDVYLKKPENNVVIISQAG